MKYLYRVLAVAIACLPALIQAAAPTSLELQQGDHIALVGNALADRMQHDGHFETLVVAQYSKLNLVFRNLAVAGDEVVTRHRSENFGSPDDWLKKVQADVILAYFGYNESFKGEAGLAGFKADLDKYLKETKGKNFSGKGAPRIVLFSPVAAERHQDPNYQDPAAINANLKLYTDAMSEVAKANDVLFVDLFTPSQQLYAKAASKKQSLTVNGFLLTEAGNKALAPVLFQGLFGKPAPTGNRERLRAAINEKNAQWHARYRTVDGYNVYGGRSALAYQPGKGAFVSDRNAAEPYISNYKVMQEEMTVRDALTANRDKRVWGVANGGDPEIDDSNLPKVTKVVSNKPGQNPDGSYKFLSGEEAISKMTVHDGMKVNLFASEEQFPKLANPVQMAWDTKGRLWVAAWPNYPERTPESKVGDSLLIFEDTDHDGRADKMTEFVGDLNCPTGFQFYKDGVLLMQAPDLWFLRDTDGDGKADWKERILMGLDSADSHHTANAICLDPGGSIYLSDGVFHRTQVETARGPLRNDDGAIYRFEPRTGKFETYVAYGFANPHGRVFDRWGNDLITDATGNNTYFGAAFSGHIDYPQKHSGMNQFWDRPSRPCPATGILSSRHFPEDMQENFLNLNVISFQGVYNVKVHEEGSGLKGETMPNLISSTDPNFRPIAISVGPDGALYFADWHKPLIGHMQHHLRDPNRDDTHGRIYRITYPSRPLLKPAKIDGQSIEALLELLKLPENGTRELAKIELGERDTTKVLAAVKKWVAGLNAQDPNYQHHVTEALWVHQWHNVVDLELLNRVLKSPEPRARAAAARVLCYWRDRVPDALARFKELAGDENPRVRLEAVRAASFYREAAAADVALEILKKPTDYYLDYTLKETLRQLQPWWRKAIAEGKPIAVNNPAGVKYLIKGVSTVDLIKLPATAEVFETILSRADSNDADRGAALQGLAKLRGTSKLAQLFAVMDSVAKSDAASAASLARQLPLQSPEDLRSAKSRLANLSLEGATPEIRQSAWAARALADGSFDGIWAEASKSSQTLTELLNGIPLLNDADFRAKALDKVKPLLSQLPPALVAAAQAKPGGEGRYVRIELPRRGTLTLAEVEVFSDGANIARKGKAKQSTTTNGGDAAKAIDGGTDGEFGKGSQTHSAENESNPWWEVDLGGNRSIDSVAVWNRTDADLGKRLDGFTLVVLDADRREVFKQTGIAAPSPRSTLKVGGDPLGALQRAAIRAAVSMNSDQEALFQAFTSLIQRGVQVPVAARALRALPSVTWPKASAAAAAQGLGRWAGSVPVSDRTTQDYVETVQTAKELAGFLPVDAARALRRELKDLGVSVFVIRTVREQMRYDTARLVVEPGKQFEILLENDDFMPHNLVFVQPGSREAVANLAAVMKPEQLDSQGRSYVPNDKNVIAGTRLIEAGQRQTLKVTAPTQPGTYEYVCTFPDHWTLMWGTLVVTPDVDAYLNAHPVSNTAKGAPAGE